MILFIRVYLEGTGRQGVDWTDLALDMDMQRVVVNTVVDLLKNESALQTKYCVISYTGGLRYKPERRGFNSRWCLWNFSLT